MDKDVIAASLSYLKSCRSSPDNFVEPDVVLVQAPCWGIQTPPFGIASLVGYLRERSFKVLPLDLNVECYLKRTKKYEMGWDIKAAFWFWDTPERAWAYSADNNDMLNRFADIIVATNTKIVGFTTQGSSVFLSIGMARRIKERNPGVTIVFGGPQAARYIQPKIILGTGYVDLMVHGEGELTLEDILLRRRAGASFERCPGTLLSRDGTIVDGGDRPLIPKLEALPYADLTDYNFECYTDPDVLPMSTSRGCINNCSFCGEVVYWDRYRGLSGERLFKEAQAQLTRYPHVRAIEFQDSLINGRLKDIEDFGQRLVANGFDVKWSGQAIMRKDLTLERLQRLKDCGCRHLTFGLESGSTQVLIDNGKTLMKGTDSDQIVRDAHKVGLACTCNFMFGLPGETETGFQDSLNFLRRNKDYIYKVNPSEALCCFTPGTDGYEHPERFGIRDVESVYYWESVDGTNTFLVRLRRFEEFCALVADLGIPTTYQHRQLLDREQVIARYYAHKERSGAVAPPKRLPRIEIINQPEQRGGGCAGTV